MLWLPTLDTIFGFDYTQPPGENRLPAPRPQLVRLDLAGVQHYLAAAEAYFNDHFGYRKRLIRWFQEWKVRLFKDESGTKVVVGQNGWYYTGEGQMVDNYLGIAPFTPERLDAWRRLLEKRRDWLAARGIRYLFVIAPDKQDIYPENLPEWLLKATPQGRKTKLDQFLNYMKDHSSVEILDLRQPLIDAKSIAPLYLQNDTHWNMLGSFIGCKAVVDGLSNQFPDLPPLRMEDFIWTNTPAMGGDQARILGLDVPEKNYFAFQSGPALSGFLTISNSAYKSNWGPKRMVITENKAPLRRTLVVFDDSFGFSWQMFLGHCFKRAAFEWESQDFNTTLILSNNPDVVVTEMLERSFDIYDPNIISAKDALP